MTKHRVRMNPSILATAIAAIVPAVHAQTTATGQIPEVVVTAQRTATLESRTPVAMSVLSGDELARAGISQPSDLAARLPNTYIEGNYDALKITIRGVTNADTSEKGDPSAAFMQDGVYIARPQVQNLSLFDIDRVEVLRGPQGTLYGRNATAGVVNVIANAPTRKLEGAVGAELGNYATRQGTAMLNVPVSDTVALRAALAVNKHDSYLINGQGTPHHLGQDRDDRAARLSAKFDFGAGSALVLRYDHSTAHDDNDKFVPDTNFYRGVETGHPVWQEGSTDSRLTNAFVPPNGPPEQGWGERTTWGIGADLTWKLGPATLYYVGSHRVLDDAFLVNYYYRVAPTFALGVRENFSGSYSQNSHELRVASNGNGPVSAQGGLYWFREQSQMLYTFRDLQLLGLPPYYVFPHGPTEAESRAAFGQATWTAQPGRRLTLGARYTTDDKSRVGSTNFQQGPDFNPATDFKLLNAAEMTTHKTTWRLGADYDLAPATLLYGAVSTGYKAGGFNDGCLEGSTALGIACPAAVAVPAEKLFYQPETLTAYEAGIKTRFWDKRASLNATVFDYDYKNLQLSNVAILQGAPRYITTNAGVASVRGLEIDGALRPTPADSLTYAATLLDAHYVSYSPDGVHSLAGHKLDRAPKATVSVGYEHRFALAGGAVRAGFHTRWSDAYVIGVPSQGLDYDIPSYTSTDAHLAYTPEGGQWTLTARVRNLENKVRPLTIDSFGMTVPSAPRTVAVRFDYSF
jgi:iron complex outermembrane receptor protein